MNLICRLCGYTWQSRTPEPKQCPKCKRYDWNIQESVIKSSGKEDRDFEPTNRNEICKIHAVKYWDCAFKHPWGKK